MNSSNGRILKYRKREMYFVQICMHVQTYPYVMNAYMHACVYRKTLQLPTFSEKGQHARLFKLLNFKLSLTYAN